MRHSIPRNSCGFKERVGWCDGPGSASNAVASNNFMIVGQGPIALAVGAVGEGLFGHFYSPLFSPFSPSLWEAARYRLKYCLKGPLNTKQPTNLNLVF